jgi:hypothetical protein
MTSMTSIGEQLTAALSAVWRAIERRHPDVPPAVLTLGTAEADRLCLVAVNRWPAAAEEAGAVHRLFVGPAVLRQDAEGVLENLLHMAAHGLAAARGISDTSRRGQYHNKKFRELAGEVGLTFDDAGTRGWDDTGVRETTGEAYKVEVRQLAAALADFPRQERPPAPPSPSSGTGKVLAMCACPYRIWTSRRTLAESTPVCSKCHRPYTAADQDPPAPSNTGV